MLDVIKAAMVPALIRHAYIMAISWLYRSSGIPISKRYTYVGRMLKEWAFHDEAIYNSDKLRLGNRQIILILVSVLHV